MLMTMQTLLGNFKRREEKRMRREKNEKNEKKALAM
jgi:hypothetical protein